MREERKLSVRFMIRSGKQNRQCFCAWKDGRRRTELPGGLGIRREYEGKVEIRSLQKQGKVGNGERLVG